MSTPEELLQALGRQARRLGNGGAGPQGSRVYRGRSVGELIPRIQQDLGEEAIVVRRRDGLTGGFLGFFQHAFVEIEAMPGPPRVDVYDKTSRQACGSCPPRPLPSPPPYGRRPPRRRRPPRSRRPPPTSRRSLPCPRRRRRPRRPPHGPRRPLAPGPRPNPSASRSRRAPAPMSPPTWPHSPGPTARRPDSARRAPAGAKRRSRRRSTSTS